MFLKLRGLPNFAFLKKGYDSSFCHHLLRIYFYFVTVIDAKWY